MKENINLEFCFKGNRTYVHGTDIYNKLLKLLHNEMNYEKFDLSFHGIAKKNINILFDKPKDEDSLKFVCKYLDNNGNRKILYGIENNSEIDCRYKYPEEDICSLSKLNIDNQEILLDENSSFSFIENTVAINKYLLENLFPNLNGKWYFTRLQTVNLFTDNIYPLKLVLKANFNFKLTKTEIFIDNKSVGFIYFSLL